MVRQQNSRVVMVAVLALWIAPGKTLAQGDDVTRPLPVGKVHRHTSAPATRTSVAVTRHVAPEPEQTSWRNRARSAWEIITAMFVLAFAVGAWVTWRWKCLESIVMFPVVVMVPFSVAALLHIATPLPIWLIGMLTVAGTVPTYLVWERVFHPRSSKAHGSARWSTLADMVKAGRIQRRGFALASSHEFALGRARGARWPRDARFRYLGHVVTCAPTGAGKGVSAVIPNLLEYPGSAVVLDLKGENSAVTARRRREMGHEVFVVDPFGVTGMQDHACNWLDHLNPSDPDVVSESAALADMLVIPDGGENAHFDDTARDLLRGLLIHVASLPDKSRCHMGEVRRLITGTQKDLTTVLADMALSSAAFGVVARAANVFLAKADRERSAVLSTAARHTSFLDDPRVVASLTHSDFRLADLKRRSMTLYVVLPPARVTAYNRLLRGFVGLSLSAITSTRDRPKFKVAFFLDEFAQLGRMSAIEEGISLVRGYGAAFWIFVQDLSQLRAVYPKWQTFLANSAKQFYGTADIDTAHYVSRSLGKETIDFWSRSKSTQSSGWLSGNLSSGKSRQQQFIGRSLLTPDEVMGLGRRPIVFINGERPYLLEQLDYRRDPEYARLADSNPYYA